MTLPVVILSGGLAVRMRPYTEKVPKAMIEVAGMPFIHWQLSLLKEKGVSQVILCLGYLGKMIEEYVGDGSMYGLKATCFYDGDKLLGTGGAIKNILNFLPDSFFVLYGDSYLEIPFEPVQDAFLGSNKQGLMTVYENQGLYDSSNVIFRDGRLLTYSKANKNPEMRHIDYGLGILRKEAFQRFSGDESFDLARVYERLAEEDQLLGYEVYERFYEIGSRSGLDELTKKLTAKRG